MLQAHSEGHLNTLRETATHTEFTIVCKHSLKKEKKKQTKPQLWKQTYKILLNNDDLALLHKQKQEEKRNNKWNNDQPKRPPERVDGHGDQIYLQSIPITTLQ